MAWYRIKLDLNVARTAQELESTAERLNGLISHYPTVHAIPGTRDYPASGRCLYLVFEDLDPRKLGDVFEDLAEDFPDVTRYTVLRKD